MNAASPSSSLDKTWATPSLVESLVFGRLDPPEVHLEPPSEPLVLIRTHSSFGESKDFHWKVL